MDVSTTPRMVVELVIRSWAGCQSDKSAAFERKRNDNGRKQAYLLPRCGNWNHLCRPRKNLKVLDDQNGSH